MKIEDAIKSKFKNAHHKLVVNLIYTAKQIEFNEEKFFKQFDLTLPQYNILRILRGQHPKPATVNLLIERMLDKSSNASRIVEKLRIKQLVERIECPDDRRAVNVKITEKGLQLLQEIDNKENLPYNKLYEIDAKEIEKFNDLLDQIREKFNQY
jgi:DNA-binding MarR family transcriptional regulator